MAAKTMRHVTEFLAREKGFCCALLSAVVLLFFGRRLFAHLHPNWSLGIVFLWLFVVILSAAFGVVRHAEVLAERFGEPYGTLILTISAVCIEVIMIAAMMLHGDPDPTLARDTIYSTLIIVINGLIGLALLLGGIKYREQQFNLKSSNSFFSMILAFVGLGLFLPALLPAASLRAYETFLVCASLLLYGIFLRVQTNEHSYFFAFRGVDHQRAHPHGPAGRGRARRPAYHVALLLATFLTLAYLAEALAIVVDDAMDWFHLPAGLDSLIVALLILSPEGLTAIRAGLHNDMQRVVNVSLGSALSTIGLTIPAVLIVGRVAHRSVVLGLTPTQAVLLLLTLLVGMNSYRMGHTNALQGAIHFVLFLAFVALIFV